MTLTTITTVCCDSCGQTETSPTEFGWMLRDRLHKAGWLTLWRARASKPDDYCPKCVAERGLRPVETKRRPTCKAS